MTSTFDPQPIAERIWREVGYLPAFPRDIVRAIMETFDALVILLPKLSIATLDGWLRDNGRTSLGVRNDRPLRGCLLARKGQGMIFLDGSLGPEERRFATAHELAHFYAHHLMPRRRAMERFGPGILPVLDGERAPSTPERLSGILQMIAIGPFEDFLTRDKAGEPSGQVVELERQADLIACELLAPCGTVLGQAACGRALERILKDDFGLPPFAAREWGFYVESLKPRSDPVILSLERAIRNKN